MPTKTSGLILKAGVPCLFPTASHRLSCRDEEGGITTGLSLVAIVEYEETFHLGIVQWSGPGCEIPSRPEGIPPLVYGVPLGNVLDIFATYRMVRLLEEYIASLKEGAPYHWIMAELVRHAVNGTLSKWGNIQVFVNSIPEEIHARICQEMPPHFDALLVKLSRHVAICPTSIRREWYAQRLNRESLGMYQERFGLNLLPMHE